MLWWCDNLSWLFCVFSSMLSSLSAIYACSPVIAEGSNVGDSCTWTFYAAVSVTGLLFTKTFLSSTDDGEITYTSCYKLWLRFLPLLPVHPRAFFFLVVEGVFTNDDVLALSLCFFCVIYFFWCYYNCECCDRNSLGLAQINCTGSSWSRIHGFDGAFLHNTFSQSWYYNTGNKRTCIWGTSTVMSLITCLPKKKYSNANNKVWFRKRITSAEY